MSAQVLVLGLVIALSGPTAGADHGRGHEYPNPDPVSTEAAQPAIALGVSSESACGILRSHVLTVEWAVTGATGPVDIALWMTPSHGAEQRAGATGPRGSKTFELSVPRGGNAVVFASATTTRGEARNTAAAALAPCGASAPDENNFGDAPPTATAGVDFGESSPLIETDAVFLGGDGVAGGRPIAVTAAGNGVGVRLTSWAVAQGAAPLRLKDSTDILDGSAVQLHVIALDPEKKTPQLLLAGTIAGGVFKMTLWSVAGDGTFTLEDSKTYGVGAFSLSTNFTVKSFAIADRVIPATGTVPDSFVVVTPITGTVPKDPLDRLRLLTWRVDFGAANLVDLDETANTGLPHPDPAIDVIYQTSRNRFVVAYRNAFGSVTHHYWDVDDFGVPTDAGMAHSGRTIDGWVDPETNSATLAEFAQDIAMVPVGARGIVSAYRPDLLGDPELVTWESGIVGCDGQCFSSPMRIGRSTQDANPGLGVALEGAPTLNDGITEAWRYVGSWGQGWGPSRGVTAFAKGDVDGDGREEVAIGRNEGSGMRFEVLAFDDQTESWVEVFDEGGAGWGPGRQVTALAMGDVDGDGDAELAVGRDGGNDAGMRYQVWDYKAGVWIPILADGGTEWGDSRSVTAMAMGDADGDGDDELAVGRNGAVDAGMRYRVLDYDNGSWVSLLEGGTGWGDGRRVTALAYGEYTLLGREALAVGRDGPDNMRWQVRYYAGGQWIVAHEDGFEWGPTRGVSALAWGDADGDGFKELAIGRNEGGNMRYQVAAYKGGAWESMLAGGGATWGSTRSIWSLAWGDADNDGRDELAMGRDDGDAMRFQAIEWDAESEEWLAHYAEGGAGWPDDFGVSALIYANVDDDEHEEFVFGVQQGGGDRYQMLDWGIPIPIRARVSDALLEANLGEGAGALYTKMPGGGLPVAQNASVGKFFTLLMVVEALNKACCVTLADPVKISDHAADNGGSHMGPEPCGEDDCLEAGDEVPLELLIYAMFNRSDNRAATAIAEHLGGGSEEAFMKNAMERMNEIFAELGQPPRFDTDCVEGWHSSEHETIPETYDKNSGLACFTNPAGSSFTTLQDLISLWRYASQDPLFVQMANTRQIPATVPTCSIDMLKCFPASGFDKIGTCCYVGQGGSKGGNGGHGPDYGITFCDGCLVMEATRIGRRLIGAVQQSDDNYFDMFRLFNWGARSIFTPDRRGAKSIGTLVRDFGVDAVSEGVAFTAAIDAQNQLQVCTYDVAAETGTIGDGACTAGGVSALPAGTPAVVKPTTMDMALVSTDRAEGDYVAGHLVPAGEEGLLSLSLTAWRVGRKLN